MKVAVCFSGQPRFVEKTYESIKKNLIDGYDVDVFVHTWIDKNGYQFRDDGSLLWKSETQPTNIDNIILDLYNPKKFLFETPKVFQPKKINGFDAKDYFVPLFTKRAQHFLTEKGKAYYVNVINSMWYSIMMSNLQKELYSKENGVVYDFVVRARFDVTYNQKIYYDMLDKNTLYAASQVHPDHIHDFFAVSNNNIMNIYSSLFNNLDFHLNKVSPDWRCGEGILKDILDLHGIRYQGFDCINPIVRPN